MNSHHHLHIFISNVDPSGDLHDARAIGIGVARQTASFGRVLTLHAGTIGANVVAKATFRRLRPAADRRLETGATGLGGTRFGFARSWHHGSCAQAGRRAS